MRLLFASLLLGIAFSGSAATVIDRIAVVVGDSVITESAITDEIRLESLQNGVEPDFSAANKHKVAERMVEQLLIQREMTNNHYAQPDKADVRAMLDELKKSRYPSDTAFQAALAHYGVTETEVLEHLNRELTTLRFIDVRFRPAVQVNEADLKDYYQQTYLPEWAKEHPGVTAPSFEESRAAVENGLTQARVDQSLDRWLGDTRTQLRIKFRREALQ